MPGNVILQPGIRMIERLRFASKFVLVGTLLLIPMAYQLYVSMHRINSDMAFAAKERSGLEMLAPAMQFMHAARLTPSTAARDKADMALKTWSEAETRNGSILQSEAAFAAVKSQWAEARGNDSPAVQEKLAAAVNAYFSLIADSSNLTLDPDIDSYYLQDAAVLRVPAALESVLGLQSGVRKARQGGLTAGELMTLSSWLSKAESALFSVQGNLSKAFTHNPELKTALAEASRDTRDKYMAFILAVRNNILEAKRSEADTARIDAMGAAAGDSFYALFDQLVPQIDARLQARIQAFEKEKRKILLITFAFIAVGIYLFMAMRSSVVAQVADMQRAVGALARGDFTHVVSTTAADEIGEVAIALEKVRNDLGTHIELERQQANDMARIKIALDNAGTPFRIADNDGKVVYANTRMFETLRSMEAAVRQHNPGFDPNRFVGSNISSLFKNPAEYLAKLAALQGLVKTEMIMGDRTFDVTTTPVVNDKGERIGTVAEWADRTEQIRIEAEKKRVADEMARIKIALDNVSTGVMIANAEREIIYVNKSVVSILKRAESEIRKQLPNFKVDTLLGTNIDVFHKNPAHQAKLLANLNGAHTAALTIGTRHMVVVANPVINDQGERLGAVAEWKDRTAEVEIEREVEAMIAAAGRGDFSARLSLEGKDEFFAKLAEGLNQLSGVVSAGLSDVAVALQAIAHGDLTRQIEGDYEGLFGQLKDDTNATIQRLQEVIGRIKEATEAVNSASQEIAAGNADLSSRTEEQASSLEETASSMEELSATVKQNAENARQANELAQQSNQAVVRGGESVQRVVSTMSDIQNSSKKIADIIGVIDSIAFQTNILALNAAVEAARAGEQGRGFAVVASEVRSLAQRSATAAKEIKGLIAESVGKVDGGAKLVEEAGNTMREVVSSFGKVANLVTDISNASREQASGIAQVSQAIGQMDEVTQQNAALVEEAAAAAESLEEQARGLVQAVAMFKLDDKRKSVEQAAPRRLARPVIANRSGGRLIPAPVASEDEWQEF